MADNYIRLQYSDNGGHDWSNWDQESIGDTGEYDQRAVFTRLGSFRQRWFRIRCTSPRKCDLLGMVATLQPTNG